MREEFKFLCTVEASTNRRSRQTIATDDKYTLGQPQYTSSVHTKLACSNRRRRLRFSYEEGGMIHERTSKRAGMLALALLGADSIPGSGKIGEVDQWSQCLQL